jgi:outer membrane protein OmpA-like peptidoglycan-associated protein
MRFLFFISLVLLFSMKSVGAQDIQSLSPTNGFWNFISLDSSETLGYQKISYSAHINYAKDTVVVRNARTNETVALLVENLTTTNIQVSYGFYNNMELGLDIPFGFSGGLKKSDLVMPEVQQSFDDGSGLNNIRINPKVTIVKPKGDKGIGIAMSMPQSIPLRNERQELLSAYYVSNIKLIVDYKYKSIRFGFNASYRHRLSSKKSKTNKKCNPLENICTNPFYLSDAFQYGVALAWKIFDRFEIISEVYGRYFYHQNINPIDMITSLRVKATDLTYLSFGMGYGLNQYISTPDFRGLFSITYVQDRLKDTDVDGVLDAVDLCKNEQEDMDKFEDQDGCPDLDNDRDMIEDQVDKCPNKAEDVDGFEDQDGCPELDNDGDGYLDSIDSCPNQAEDFDKYQDNDGCPDDNDISKNVKIHRGQLVVAGRFYFGKDSSNILIPESDFVLNSLADMLLSNQRIKKVVIESHIDNQYDELTNLRITQGRADNIRKHLIDRGVEDYRIDAIGYGSLKPILYVKNGSIASKNILLKIKEYE